jgi:hypothetical protein
MRASCGLVRARLRTLTRTRDCELIFRSKMGSLTAQDSHVAKNCSAFLSGLSQTQDLGTP